MPTTSIPKWFQSKYPAIHTYCEKFGVNLPGCAWKFVVDNDLFAVANKDMQEALDKNKPLGDLRNYVERLAEDFHRQRAAQFLSKSLCGIDGC